MNNSLDIKDAFSIGFLALPSLVVEPSFLLLVLASSEPFIVDMHMVATVEVTTSKYSFKLL